MELIDKEKMSNTQVKCPNCNFMIDRDGWGVGFIARRAEDSKRDQWNLCCPRCNYKVYDDEMPKEEE